jgi:amidase
MNLEEYADDDALGLARLAERQFMVAYNVTGQPAMSLPLGMHSSGLPIGVQLGARPGEDHPLIELGTALERAMPRRVRIPPMHVTYS